PNRYTRSWPVGPALFLRPMVTFIRGEAGASPYSVNFTGLGASSTSWPASSVLPRTRSRSAMVLPSAVWPSHGETNAQRSALLDGSFFNSMFAAPLILIDTGSNRLNCLVDSASGNGSDGAGGSGEGTGAGSGSGPGLGRMTWYTARPA